MRAALMDVLLPHKIANLLRERLSRDHAKQYHLMRRTSNHRLTYEPHKTDRKLTIFAMTTPSDYALVLSYKYGYRRTAIRE